MKHSTWAAEMMILASVLSVAASGQSTAPSAQDPAPASTTQSANAPSPGAAQPDAAKDDNSKPKDPHVFVLGDTPEEKSAAGIVKNLPETVTNVPIPDKPITHQTRLDLIRSLNAEIAYAKRPLPRGEKGVTLPANGRLEPGQAQIDEQLMRFGPAAKKGDKVQITDMEVTGKTIRFELNGGPRKKSKWYEHISVSANGGGMTPGGPGQATAMLKGTYVTLKFPKFVPEMSAADVRQLLSPVLDFSVKSPMQAYADTLPPKVRAAVLKHEALVGMTHEMVMASMGRPDGKFRENEDGTDFEDWMYGKAPADVKWLRFKGDELVRIKIMPVGEEAIVRDKPEIDDAEMALLHQYDQQRADQVKLRKAAAVTHPAPTLRRPGDPAPPVDANTTTAGGATPPLHDPNRPDISQAPGQQDPGAGYPGPDGTGQQGRLPGQTPSGQSPVPMPAPPGTPGTTGTGTGPQ
ncbi:MAG TPA: hypothetical protein VGC88_12800 [Terriglobales bacterium]